MTNNTNRVTAENAVRTAFTTLSEFRDDLTLDTQWADRWTIETDAGLWIAIYVTNQASLAASRVPISIGYFDAVSHRSHLIDLSEPSLDDLVDTITNVFTI